MPFLCLVAKKWRKKGRPDVPSGASLRPAVLTMNGGAVALEKVLHLGRIYRTPKMGLLLAKFVAFSFLFEICASSGALQGAKVFSFTSCVTLPCWRFHIKTPTQGLNLLDFAKTLEVREHRQFWRCQGRSRRERPSSLSFALSLWNDKERAQKHSASACGNSRTV